MTTHDKGVLMSIRTFGAMLNAHRIAVGLSQNVLARRAGIDVAYVNRFVKGQQSNPSRAVTLSLAGALAMTADETDRLLFLAGHAPQRDWQAVALEHERVIARIGLLAAGLAVLPADSVIEEVA